MTLIDVAKLKADDRLVALLDEASLAVPEIRVIPGMPISGTSFQTIVRTLLPTVAFRTANNGSATSKSGYVNRRFSTYPITPRFEVDEVVADQHPQKAAGALAEEGVAMMTASLIQAARVFWYGQAFDAAAFPGCRELVTTANSIDAGGTGDSRTECYLIRTGPLYSQWIFGEGGMIQLGEPRKETLTGENSESLDGWVQTAKGYIGAMHRSPRTIVRIYGITSSAKLTDAILLDAYSRFPDEAPPTDIFCNMLGQTTLTSSRVTTEVRQPKLATDWNGIPIHRTGAIITGAADAIPTTGTAVSNVFGNED